MLYTNPLAVVDNAAFINTFSQISTLTIDPSIEAIMTAGYSEVGDGGSGLYRKEVTEPSYPPYTQSLDGAYWILSESVINPIMFGAIPDGVTPCDEAFENMSLYVEAVKNISEIKLSGDPRPADTEFIPNSYLLSTTGWRLPTFRWFETGSSAFSQVPVIKINGSGSILYTEAENIKLMHRMPEDQDDAVTLLEMCRYEIDGITFSGTATGNQIGLAIGATVNLSVRNCVAYAMQIGFAGIFCLESSWSNMQSISSTKIGFALESGEGPYSGLGWSGANGSNSASNVSILNNIRDYGSPTQDAQIVISGSDSVTVNQPVMEGNGPPISYVFDYNGSTTVKSHTINSPHFENPNVQLLMRLRTAGIVEINAPYWQYSAAIIDAHDSAASRYFLNNVPWYPGLPPASPQNPDQRLFFHTNGTGWGGSDDSGNSSGSFWHLRYAAADQSMSNFVVTSAWENDTRAVSGEAIGTFSGYDGIGTFHFAPPQIFNLPTVLGGLASDTLYEDTNTLKLAP